MMKENKHIDINVRSKYSGGHALETDEYKPLTDRADPDQTDKLMSCYDNIMILLRSQTGHDFSAYKKSTIHRRIERRMGIHQIERIETYFCFLQENPLESELLFREFLIGVTNFFR